MENEDNNKNEEEKDNIDIETIDVHMFDLGLKGATDKLMSSNFICGLGALVSLGLAFAFGLMFLIGGVGLLKGKHSDTEHAVEAGFSEESAGEASEGEEEE